MPSPYRQPILNLGIMRRSLYRTNFCTFFVFFIVIVLFIFAFNSNLDSTLRSDITSHPKAATIVYTARETPNHNDEVKPSEMKKKVKENESHSRDSVSSRNTNAKEGIFEKIEYGLIKLFMGKLLDSHMKRKQKFSELHKNVERHDHKPVDVADFNNMNFLLHQNDKSGNRGDELEKDSNMSSATALEEDRLTTEYKIESRTEGPYPESTVPTGQGRTVPPKKILFYTRFFGHRKWDMIFGNETQHSFDQCPVSNCVVSFKPSEAREADALIFHAFDYNPKKVPVVRRPHQRYIWMTHEAPELADNTSIVHTKGRPYSGGFFNWTFTYHRDSDLLLLYGGLMPRKAHDGDFVRPGLLDRSGSTYQNYLAALQRGDRLEDNELGRNWTGFLSRPKLVVWMVSHCTTVSGRELYVQELKKYVLVDVYGRCGTFRCGKDHHDSECYTRVLTPTYKFYLAFENSMCQDYITEKMWYPLHFGMVPVVYGGANYSHFLPPNSFVDATYLTPQQLARILLRDGASPERYAKYHLWRRYWKVLVHPPLCELCSRLHYDHVPTTTPTRDPAKWWKAVNNCTTFYSLKEFPRFDIRLLNGNMDHDLKAIGSAIGTMMRG